MKLKSVVEEPTLFNPVLVAECIHEIEVREKSVALMPKVAGFDNQRLREILDAPTMYSEELIYACQLEMSNRIDGRQREEEMPGLNLVLEEKEIGGNTNLGGKNVVAMWCAIGGLSALVLTIFIVFIFTLITPSKNVEGDRGGTSRGNYTSRATSEHSTSDSSDEDLNGDYFPPGLYPLASLRYLTPSDLYGMSKWELKIMRNEILARHGYIFKTSAMINYFSRQSWYRPEYVDVSSMMTPMEWQNIALIKEFEKM